MTEVEIYDTEQPPDPTTGERPLKARIRQRHGEGTTDRVKAEVNATENSVTTAAAEQVYSGGELSEVTVTAEKPPGLWERVKHGAAWAAAIMIPAAIGWTIHRIKKAKRHERRNQR